MWQPLTNFYNSLTTYHLLSPDLDVRQRVVTWLSTRPCLTCDEWFRRYWVPPQVTRPVPGDLILFIFERLEAYSGLPVGYLQPQDRLVEDLHFPAICWFDWGLTLCDDFHTTFGLDITDHFDETQFTTCAELVIFLADQLPSCHQTTQR
jgi:hypothetical protein